MSVIKTGFSAIGKLLMVIALAGTFLVGMFGVVYMSLQGEEITVPEIVGKDFRASESELAALGLKIKKRAERFSKENPNTILEQLPKAGDTVKTGQMILVIVSKPTPEGEKETNIFNKDDDQDDTDKIEELISDKPKKSNKNTNSNKKKSSTTRDVIKEDTSKESDSSTTNSNSNKKESGSGDKPTNSKENKSDSTSPTNKQSNPSNSNKTSSNKTSTSGETRPRTTPKP